MFGDKRGTEKLALWNRYAELALYFNSWRLWISPCVFDVSGGKSEFVQFGSFVSVLLTSSIFMILDLFRWCNVRSIRGKSEFVRFGAFVFILIMFLDLL